MAINMSKLTFEDTELLKEIAKEKRYSIVRFEVSSSKDESLRMTALPNVHLKYEDESIEVVKARGAALQRLNDDGYIEIDFRPGVFVVADFEIYPKSGLYAQLCELTEKGKSKHGFLFDASHIKKGRVALTKKGRAAVEKNQQDDKASKKDAKQNKKDGKAETEKDSAKNQKGSKTDGQK